MTDRPEDGDPVWPAYGPAGRPPPPPLALPAPFALPPPTYPPPGDQAPPRRHTGLLWVLVAVVAAAVAIAVVLSFTLRTRVLDRAAVQRDVAAQFRDHEGVAIRLDCADAMPLTTGATYRCQGTTTAGEHVTLLIRVTDARTARYTWSEQR